MVIRVQVDGRPKDERLRQAGRQRRGLTAGRSCESGCEAMAGLAGAESVMSVVSAGKGAWI